MSSQHATKPDREQMAGIPSEVCRYIGILEIVLDGILEKIVRAEGLCQENTDLARGIILSMVDVPLEHEPWKENPVF